MDIRKIVVVLWSSSLIMQLNYCPLTTNLQQKMETTLHSHCCVKWTFKYVLDQCGLAVLNTWVCNLKLNTHFLIADASLYNIHLSIIIFLWALTSSNFLWNYWAYFLLKWQAKNHDSSRWFDLSFSYHLTPMKWVGGTGGPPPIFWKLVDRHLL